MILIIRGGSGVGKTRTAQELASRHRPSIHLVVDELHHWITDRTLNDDQVALSVMSAGSVARVFANRGYTVCIDFVFVRAWEVDEFLQGLGAVNTDIYLFTLTAQLDILRARDRKRCEEDIMGDRVEELYREFQNSDESRGYPIDSSKLEVGGVVREIEDAISNGKGRIKQSTVRVDNGKDWAEAAVHNRRAWDSYRRQREEGLVNNWRSPVEEIRKGASYVEEKWIDLVGSVSGKKLLDLGCGDGGETCCWARLGASVVGVDNSPMQLKAAKRAAMELGVKCDFVLADILNLPEELLNHEFDVVFTAWVAAWIGDLRAWFHNVYKALNWEGRFLFVWTHPVTRIAAELLMDDSTRASYFDEGVFIRKQEEERSTGNPAGDDFTTYQWCHTLESVLKAMKDVGFRSVEMVESDASSPECKELKGMPTDVVILARKH